MTGRQTALRPLDRPDGLPRIHAPLVGGVLASPSARIGDGSRSTVRRAAAVLGAVVALPLRKVR